MRIEAVGLHRTSAGDGSSGTAGPCRGGLLIRMKRGFASLTRRSPRCRRRCRLRESGVHRDGAERGGFLCRLHIRS